MQTNILVSFHLSRLRAWWSVALSLLVPLLAANASATNLFDEFNPNANNAVQALAVQADGRLLVGGAFNAVGGVGFSRLARLNADGSVDSSFRTLEVNGSVYSIASLPDGRMIVAGSFSMVRPQGFPIGAGLPAPGIVRLDASGFWDPAFSAAVSANGNQGNVFRVLPLANGQLLIGGHFTNVNGSGRAKIARLNSNGSVDTTFNAGSMNLSDYVWTLAEQADGKIVVGGGFSYIGGKARRNFARLNANGSADNNFTAGVSYSTTAYPSVSGVLVQPDGMIIITGQFDLVHGRTQSWQRQNVARITSAGDVDTSYIADSRMDGPIHAAVLQPDGRVLIGGSFTWVRAGNDPLGTLYSRKLARLNANGSVDRTFSVQGAGSGDVYTLARQTDGKTVIGGNFTSINGLARNRLARLYGTYVQTYSGSRHACGLTPVGSVECWGSNEYGQLGDGTTNDRATPIKVVGLGNVSTMSIGLNHTCALLNDGSVRCWGYNAWGQLGDDTTTNRSTPVSVVGLYGPQTSISLGNFHSCAAQIDHTNPQQFQCWGANYVGQLADGTYSSRNRATTPIFLNNIREVAAWGDGTCVDTWSGTESECWGSW